MSFVFIITKVGIVHKRHQHREVVMDKIKFFLTALLLIVSMQTLALYHPVVDQPVTDRVLLTNTWVAWLISPEK